MGGGTGQQFPGEAQLRVWWESLLSWGVVDEGYTQVSSFGFACRRKPEQASSVDLPEADRKRLGRGSCGCCGACPRETLRAFSWRAVFHVPVCLVFFRFRPNVLILVYVSCLKPDNLIIWQHNGTYDTDLGRRRTTQQQYG